MNAVSGTRRAIKELVDGTIRVQVDIDPPFRKAFFDLFPEIDMRVALVPLRSESASDRTALNGTEHEVSARTPAPSAEPNTLAQRMHIDGYFRNPRLWAAMESAGIYTQDEHKKWIEQQPCCGSELVGPTHSNPLGKPHACSGDICAHHTPSAALPAAGRKSENPRKPPHWHTVPACAGFHAWCHSSTGANREDKQKLVELGIAMTAQQIKAAMKQYLGIESLRDLSLPMLNAFEDEMRLQRTNPQE